MPFARRSATFVFALACVASAPAQLPVSPTLLTDINTDPSQLVRSARPWGLAQASGRLVFRAESEGTGAEPYVTDGTATGTLLLGDLLRGPNWSNPSDAIALSNGDVVFGADSTDYGTEPWILRAGSTTPQLIKDIRAGAAGSRAGVFTAWQGEVWFLADDGTSGIELWRTDGTPGGTVLADDTVPGRSGMSNGTSSMRVAGGKLFIVATSPLKALWVKASPLTPAVEIAVFAGPSFATTLRHLEEVGGFHLFNAVSSTAGEELWRSDGTATGTALLVDLRRGAPGSGPRFVATDGTTLWFTAYDDATGREPYVSDGTAAGTRLLLDIHPGPSDSMRTRPGAVTPYGAMFAADDGFAGEELWVSQGTAATTRRVADIWPGPIGSSPSSFLVYGNEVFFTANDGPTGFELWRTDGTASGTQPVIDIVPGAGSSYPTPLGSAGGDLIFTAVEPDLDEELWRTRGTAASTVQFAEINPDPLTLSSYPDRFGSLGRRRIFAATTPSTGEELWITDGTAAGTSLVIDLNPATTGSMPVPIADLGDRALFSADDGIVGKELWGTDGTASGTRLVVDLFPGSPSSRIRAAGQLGRIALFTATDGGPAGESLWRSDGTAAATSIVAVGLRDVNWASANGGRQVSAARRANGLEPWVTDATPAGTFELGDLQPGPVGSSPDQFAPFGSGWLFRANTTGFGHEVWRTDGTVTGTRMVADVNQSGSSYPVDFVDMGGFALFSADDGVTGRELWRTDGTAAGTTQVVDLLLGPSGSRPAYLTLAGDRAFFFAEDAAGTQALWMTDGTASGTTLVAVMPVIGLAWLSALGSGRHVVFGSTDNLGGGELWMSDGTAAGTRQLAESAAGPRTAWPGHIARTGTRLTFSADDLLSGREIHGLPLAAAGDVWVAAPFGHGCGATLSVQGSARRGATLTFDIGTTRAQAPVWMLLSTRHAELPLGACRLRVAPPLVVVPAGVSLSGALAYRVRVPGAPSSQGVELFFQATALQVGGPVFGTLELSNGVEVLISN